MASVRLASLWLQSATDPAGDAIAPNATAVTDNPAGSGGLRPYAGGRQRWVNTAAGTTRKISVTLTLATPVQLAWLNDHIGALLLLRDFSGRVVYGSYAGFTATLYPFGNYHDISGLDFYEVTHQQVLGVTTTGLVSGF